METQVVKVEKNEAQVAPTNMVMEAMQRGATPEQIEKFIGMQERIERREAEKAYVAAMTAFKANPPKIFKDKHVAFGNTKYNHATLANITTVVGAALAEHGLTASWQTDQDEAKIVVSCRITHILGHSESTTLHTMPDNSGGKNSIQAIGSAVTYLQRYTLLALCGLATHEHEDDGAMSEPINDEQLATIEDMISEYGVDRPKFLGWCKVGKLSDIKAADFKKVLAALKSKAPK
ncbi:conserved protein of unknown function [Pseudodesulfovibrio profundus]|uniref:ERF family protein n=1 Tax=Pseudodesulfovibrio profundus TaxID=57320 RepID=A0A2C8FDJ7_9BACT|nr:ERF family protein [Pseudodesulfovibrio profundus]SOB60610.1 conserved protein of unknown function [Pseudodesulfovibrio profundus]